MFHDLFFSKSKGRLPKPCPIALSTRVRLARNLREFPFPGRAQSGQKKAVLSKCMNALGKVKNLKACTSVELDELSELDRQILVEKHLISLELSQSDESGGVVLSDDRSCSVMVNEEDHLRIQVLTNGLNFKKVWKLADTLDSGIESNLDYAFDTQLGFLTACPTNLGTGMRASVMMHLPGLVLSKNMDKVMEHMKSGKSMEEAVRAAYPDYDDDAVMTMVDKMKKMEKPYKMSKMGGYGYGKK